MFIESDYETAGFLLLNLLLEGRDDSLLLICLVLTSR